MGKKVGAKAAAAKTGAASSKAGAAAWKNLVEEETSFQTGDWAKSLVSEKDINELKDQGLLDGMEYQVPGDEEVPNPPEGWRVIFLSFLFRGLSLPAHEFLRGLLFVYGVQVWQLTPNAILHIAVFITFCECYLGIAPHFGLWKALYQVRPNSKNDSSPIYTIGGCSFATRGGKNSLGYVKNFGQDSVIGWRTKWFYVKDQPVDGQQFNLAPFIDGKPVSLKSWSNDLSEEETAEVKKLLPSLKEAMSHL